MLGVGWAMTPFRYESDMGFVRFAVLVADLGESDMGSVRFAVLR